MIENDKNKIDEAGRDANLQFISEERYNISEKILLYSTHTDLTLSAS